MGETLLIIGRQVRTPYGKFIDLVAIDIDGNMHVLELKRDRTPREVVAQVLDYATWVTTLTHEAITDMASDHLGEPLEVAFQRTFGEPLPDEINADIRLTVVASSLDNSSERIIGYLREFGVPINAVFFSYLEDGERKYLARSWLASDLESKPQLTPTAGRGKRADWNGRDWYASFGEGPGGRSWDDGRRFGFVSAGGGRFYSRTLRNVPPGARVNVCIPQAGYVGIGDVTGPAQRFDEAMITVNGTRVPLAKQELKGQYSWLDGGEPASDDMAEWVLPVHWIKTFRRSDAYWETGMFANQNSACRLRQQFTLDRLADHFKLSDSETE